MPKITYKKTADTKQMEKYRPKLKIQARVATLENGDKTYVLFNSKGKPFYDTPYFEQCFWRIDIESFIRERY